MFIALSICGALLKFPSIIGSVALDSFPSLIAVAIFGGVSGGIVASIGHIVSALLAGLPLGPFHFLIAIEMFVLVYLFSIIYRSGNKILSGLFFVICNGFLLPLPFLFLMGKGFYMAIIPSLAASSFLNVLIGFLLIPRIQKLKGYRGSDQ
jgi:uncharacterized membrane protein